MPNLLGDGKHYFNQGDIYEGNWEKFIRHGKGKQIYKNGNVYEGNWEKHVK